MRRFTICVSIAILALVVALFATCKFSASDLANNLTAELTGALLTVVVVQQVTRSEDRKRRSAWAAVPLSTPVRLARRVFAEVLIDLQNRLREKGDLSEQYKAQWESVVDTFEARRLTQAALIGDEMMRAVGVLAGVVTTIKQAAGHHT